MRVPFSRFSWLLPRVFWGKEQIWWRGCRVNVNPGEVHGYYVFFLGEYASEEIDLLIMLCSSARIFVDVGANIGLVTLAVAQACPNLCVHAFEPDPIIIARLKANLDLNPLLKPRILVVEKAAADQDVSLQFVSASGYNAEIGRLLNGDEAGGLQVEAIKLDTYFQSVTAKPDILKIDVEGAELKVLEGMTKLLSTQNLQHILVEVHAFYLVEERRGAFKERVEALLHEAEYRLEDVTGNRLPSAANWPERIHVHATLQPQP